MNEMNDFLNKLSKEEFREFIVYCNEVYTARFFIEEHEEMKNRMKEQIVRLKQRAKSVSNQFIDTQTDSSGITISDSDPGL